MTSHDARTRGAGVRGGTPGGGGELPILMYHSVRDERDPAARRYVTAPAALAEQLDALVAAGWEFLTFTAAAHRLDSGPLGRACVLTFDDAYTDFHDTALPLLAERGITGTLFVPTGAIGGTDEWLGRWTTRRHAVMSAAQLRATAAAGFEVGSHSHRHAELDRLAARELAGEVARPRQILEDLLGAAVTSFAYPYGYHSPRVRRAVTLAGYRAAAAVSNRVARAGDHALAVPRLEVLDGMTGADLLHRMAAPRSVPGDVMVWAKHWAWRAWRELRR